MSDATFAVDNAVPILSNAIFMQNLFAMLAFNYAIYFTLPLIIREQIEFLKLFCKHLHLYAAFPLETVWAD